MQPARSMLQAPPASELMRQGDVAAVLRLARACKRNHQLKECEEASRWLLARAAHTRAARDLLAFALVGQGRAAEAAPVLRDLLSETGSPEVHSRLIFNALLDPNSSDDVLLELNRELERHASAGSSPSYEHDTDPERVLTVGFVGADFKHHARFFNTRTLFGALDRRKVRVFLYSMSEPDAHTALMRCVADEWCDSRLLSDEDLAARIRADGIDILVDLVGHCRGNRLTCFLRRPAPIQVEYLEPPSGLNAFDYRITDAKVDPPGTMAYGAAIPVVLAHGFHAFEPPDATPILHALERSDDRPSFGCFNHSAKLNERVLNAWGVVLSRVPESILVLKNPAMADPLFVSELHARFAQAGVDPARVRCFSPCPDALHLRMYDLVDIALDTFPYNGVTTTFEAIWMGVPVVTFPGTRHVTRKGASVLASAGLDDWIAKNEQDYIDVAVDRIGRYRSLRHGRARMRESVRTSAACDEARLAREMERSFRAMWRAWCAGKTPAQSGLGPTPTRT